jgi:hypothetical protein
MFLFIGISCNTAITKDSGKSEISVTDSTNQTNAASSSVSDLLQGKWQSTDDKTNFVVFEKNHRKEIAAGMSSWDDEEFELSDHCLNESNVADKNAKSKDSYISCKKSDLCWNIVSISNEKLTLEYMGRGNMLNYIKVK